ncbi:hypothetical protein V8C86DRAFT_451443 [Haematococcus lacustris]
MARSSAPGSPDNNFPSPLPHHHDHHTHHHTHHRNHHNNHHLQPPQQPSPPPGVHREAWGGLAQPSPGAGRVVESAAGLAAPAGLPPALPQPAVSVELQAHSLHAARPGPPLVPWLPPMRPAAPWAAQHLQLMLRPSRASGGHTGGVALQPAHSSGSSSSSSSSSRGVRSGEQQWGAARRVGGIQQDMAVHPLALSHPAPPLPSSSLSSPPPPPRGGSHLQHPPSLPLPSSSPPAAASTSFPPAPQLYPLGVWKRDSSSSSGGEAGERSSAFHSATSRSWSGEGAAGSDTYSGSHASLASTWLLRLSRANSMQRRPSSKLKLGLGPQGGARQGTLGRLPPDLPWLGRPGVRSSRLQGAGGAPSSESDAHHGQRGLRGQGAGAPRERRHPGQQGGRRGGGPPPCAPPSPSLSTTAVTEPGPRGARGQDCGLVQTDGSASHSPSGSEGSAREGSAGGVLADTQGEPAGSAALWPAGLWDALQQHQRPGVEQGTGGGAFARSPSHSALFFASRSLVTPRSHSLAGSESHSHASPHSHATQCYDPLGMGRAGGLGARTSSSVDVARGGRHAAAAGLRGVWRRWVLVKEAVRERGAAGLAGAPASLAAPPGYGPGAPRRPRLQATDSSVALNAGSEGGAVALGLGVRPADDRPSQFKWQGWVQDLEVGQGDGQGLGGKRSGGGRLGARQRAVSDARSQTDLTLAAPQNCSAALRTVSKNAASDSSEPRASSGVGDTVSRGEEQRTAAYTSHHVAETASARRTALTHVTPASRLQRRGLKCNTDDVPPSRALEQSAAASGASTLTRLKSTTSSAGSLKPTRRIQSRPATTLTKYSEPFVHAAAQQSPFARQPVAQSVLANGADKQLEQQEQESVALQWHHQLQRNKPGLARDVDEPLPGNVSPTQPSAEQTQHEQPATGKPPKAPPKMPAAHQLGSPAPHPLAAQPLPRVPSRPPETHTVYGQPPPCDFFLRTATTTATTLCLTLHPPHHPPHTLHAGTQLAAAARLSPDPMAAPQAPPAPPLSTQEAPGGAGELGSLPPPAPPPLALALRSHQTKEGAAASARGKALLHAGSGNGRSLSMKLRRPAPHPAASTAAANPPARQ